MTRHSQELSVLRSSFGVKLLVCFIFLCLTRDQTDTKDEHAGGQHDCDGISGADEPAEDFAEGWTSASACRVRHSLRKSRQIRVLASLESETYPRVGKHSFCRKDCHELSIRRRLVAPR